MKRELKGISMGFLFPHMDMGKEHKPHAGEDYEPAPGEGSYKPLINVHTNHSNLEGGGFYDPRRDLDKTLSLGQEEDIRSRRRALTIALALILLFVVGLAVVLSQVPLIR
jgi:hypothetical protein